MANRRTTSDLRSRSTTPPTARRRFRVIFARYGSNLAYGTVFYSDLFYGFGYRLRSYGYGDRSGVRRSQNGGHSDRYRPKAIGRIEKQDSGNCGRTLGSRANRRESGKCSRQGRLRDRFSSLQKKRTDPGSDF